jgi:hypothetical protein
MIPAFCKNMKVFVSYAREDKDVAKQIYLALADENCEVFFDEDSILSGNFRNKIMSFIDKCDLFVFLVSKYSLRDERFVQAELSRIKKRFLSPNGKVIPVIVDKDVSIESLSQYDIYLTSNHVVSLPGDIVAKTVNAVNDARYMKKSCKLVFSVLVALLLSSSFLMLYHLVVPLSADMELVKPEKVEFRTLEAPPLCEKPDLDNAAWLSVDTMLTVLNMNYANRSPKNSEPVRVLNVKALLSVDDAEPIEYEWYRIMDISNNAVRKDGSAWISDVADAESFTISSGRVRDDELSFKPVRFQANPWKKFVSNQIYNGYPAMNIKIEAKIEYFGWLGTESKWISVECDLKVKDDTKVAFDGYLKRCNRLPGFFVAHCE